MSVDYAAGLSDYDDLGICGQAEIEEDFKSVREKVKLLASWLRQHEGSCVVHVGAGLSTSAGIPDFRGKSGVWTKLLQKRGQAESKKDVDIKQEEGVQQEMAISFDKAVPTISHLILKDLCNKRLVGHIISQNVDGLFLKADTPRFHISELHGNFFLDECTLCKRRYIRSEPSKTMKLTKSTTRCQQTNCRGYLRDTILDWESPIPHHELRRSQKASKQHLHIIVGSTVQLCPAKNLVFTSKRGKKYKLVVINLQPTQFDKDADLVINHYADDVMRLLAEELDILIPEYDATNDPTKTCAGTEWKR